MTYIYTCVCVRVCVCIALHMCAYMQSCADNDLSRAHEFEELCDAYSNVAEGLVNSVESDHLLSILLETPTDCTLARFF